MPKHDHEQGAGVKLAGSPEQLINRLIAAPEEANWATDHLINKGPKHKQVLSAILLKRLLSLVATVEKSTGHSFELQKGIEIVKETKDEEITYPINLPFESYETADAEKIAEAISHAPEHELLAYMAALQVIEWVIKTSPVNSSNK